MPVFHSAGHSLYLPEVLSTPYTKMVNILAASFFVLIGSSSFFVDNIDNHKVSDKFEIRPDPTMDCCP